MYVIKRERNNKNTKKFLKKNLKKVKKTLDKSKKVWYNKYVIKRETSSINKIMGSDRH